ncbi:MAG: hypothetical protein HKO66_15170, partial [Saprospiraceae bacterium]|nr:hypothetical protein [Saprospiraceae bacterium]
MKTIKTVTSLPSTYFNEHLSNAIKFSHNLTRTTFFSSLPIKPYAETNKAAINSALQTLAITYVANVISKTTFFGFNKCIVGGTDTLIDNWFLKNSNTVGQNLLVDYLLQPNLLGNFEPDRATLAKSIADNASSDQFLTAFLLDCDTLKSMLPAKLLLMMLKIIDNSGPNYRKVHQVWVGNERWEVIKDFEFKNWLDVSKPSFRQNMPLFTQINPLVKAAIAKADPPIVKHYTAANWAHRTETTTKYGMAAQNWIGSAARPNGFFSGTWADNVIKTDTKDGGCLAEGTKMLLANGNSKNIEDLQPGDILLSANGSKSAFSGELTLNENVDAFYSINDDKPFMSLEHVVMSQKGWCSMSPTLSMNTNPHLSVTQLEVGDVIWKVKKVNGLEVEYEMVVVEQINIHHTNYHGPVKAYALNLRGDQSNHANAYCCHSGYPNITATYVAANVATKMEEREQKRFFKQLEKMAPQFEKAIGKGPFKFVMHALKDAKQINSNAPHTDKHGKLKSMSSGVKHLAIPNYNLHHIEGNDSITKSINQFGILNGHCFINGDLIDTQSNSDTISWSREVDGQKEEGSIKLFSHKLIGRGHIKRGKVTASFMLGAMNVYKMDIGKGQDKWLNLKMGSKPDGNGSLHYMGYLEDPNDPSNNEDLKENSTVIFSEIKETGMLHASISFDLTYCSFGGSDYIEAEIDFSPNYMDFSGEIFKYDEEKDNNNYKGEKKDLVGSYIETTTVSSFKKQLTKKMKTQPAQLVNLDLSGVSSSDHIKNGAFTAMTEILDVSVLAGGLNIPDQQLVQRSTFGKLKELMLVALANKDEQTFSFFGQKKPVVGKNGDLSEKIAAIANDSKMSSFLTDKFAVGYLTQAFSASTDDKIKPKYDAVPNLEDKLSYFWKGKNESSFAADPQYNIATEKLQNYVYAENVPGLTDYIADGGEKWAKALYDYMTFPPTLEILALSNDLDNKRRLTHLCSILQALDSTGQIKNGDKLISYSTSLYSKVIERRLGDFGVKSKLSGKEEYTKFMTEYFKQYIASILDPTSSWSTEVRAEAKKDLDELRKVIGAKEIADLASEMKGIISNAASVIGKFKHGPLAKKINDWAKGYAAESVGKDRAVKIGKFMGNILAMGTYAFGFSQLIQAFFNWDKLTDPQRVSLVATTLNMGASIFNDIASWRSAKLVASADSKFSEIIKAQRYLNTRLE